MVLRVIEHCEREEWYAMVLGGVENMRFRVASFPDASVDVWCISSVFFVDCDRVWSGMEMSLLKFFFAFNFVLQVNILQSMPQHPNIARYLELRETEHHHWWVFIIILYKL